MIRRTLAAASALALSLVVAARADAPASDPFLWLEDVYGTRAQTWVKAQNAKTLAALQKDPRFATFDSEAEAIAGAKDRIPSPTIIKGVVYNFWQDAANPRGLWRETSLADYATATPTWKTVIDLDALAKSEGKNWIWEGANCDSPSRTRCLISLSDGGEDAQTIREFDLKTGAFVEGGFVLPHGKQNATWVDDDTLLVAREWAPGELTSSGYPYVVKQLKRGQTLDAATEVFRGAKTDVSDDPFELHDGDGHRLIGLSKSPSFFDSKKYLFTPSGPVALDLPLQANFQAMVAGKILIELDEDWATAGATFGKGSLVALDYAAVTADPTHLKPTLVYAPGPRETLDGVTATHDKLLVTILDNVKGRAFTCVPSPDGTWSKSPLTLPDDSTIHVVDADLDGSTAFLDVEGFLTPSTLWQIDTTAGTLAAIKSAPPKFDASHDVVEQLEATSKDGTRIPYFVVHPKGMIYDGSTPTIMTAYGGFNVSETPNYSGTLGKIWLERGGAYVLANIRGGGEFGPAWHDAGLKTHRQRIYDDFAAVARALETSRITSPKHLGIIGGSNGGLLMGVEFTQHPELYNAVYIAVPLLDMLRFEKIAAGASWVGEYGSVSVPAERKFLASISPYNNLHADKKYPKPFIFTTTKDDRVGPQHARKFAAKLAAMHVPYYFYEVIEGGHSTGANIKERSLTAALEYTYFAEQLGATATHIASR
jgi:prolyl oligopeptidase